MNITRVSTVLSAAFLAGILPARAYDLTPCRGHFIQSLISNGGLTAGNGTGGTFKVFNSHPTSKYGPINSFGNPWSWSHTRDRDGKPIGTPKGKPSSCQYDMTSITNGWFTPASKDLSGCNSGTRSYISSGWEDTYSIGVAGTGGTTGLVLAAAHVRVDPYNLYTGDVNRVNNEAFVSLEWNPTAQKYYPMQNVDIPTTNMTLASGDSVFYGAYSTTASAGNITVNSNSSTQRKEFFLTAGNQKVGFQARRMKLVLTGGGRNKYVIGGGSVVTAEFLGQNTW